MPRQRMHLQVGLVLQRAGLGDEQVDLVVAQARQQFVPLADLDPELAAWMGPDEACHRTADDGFGGKRPRPHRQLGAGDRRIAEQLVVQVVGHPRDLPGMADDHAPQVRGHHAMAFAQEQRRPDLRFQRLDAARQRRLADVQGHGRAAEAAVLVQGKDVAELAQLDRHALKVSGP